MVRVRFAPSPTGIPHVGNIRTALFNYFFAKANNGEFILRIEDTDRERIVEGAEKAIEESLKWLGIIWEKKIVQSERLSEYKKFADQLVSEGKAREDGGAIRFIVPKEGVTNWTDEVGNKKIEFKNLEIEDFILLKSDGYPTYHLANIIDDHREIISHVIRGEDWIPSTPKHIMLYKAFGWEIPKFVHVPNILGTDGKKLSKRHGAKSVLDFKKEGILREALLNYLMLLGFSPKDDREILSKEEFEREFSLSKINTAPGIFDERKLFWMNGEYIRKIEKSDLKNRLMEFYKGDKETSKILTEENSSEWIKATSSRMKTLEDFKNLISTVPTRKKTKQEKGIAIELSDFLKVELGEGKWEDEKFLAALKNFSKDKSIPFKTIYFLLTKKEHGIGLLELNQIYGKSFFINNLSND